MPPSDRIPFVEFFGLWASKTGKSIASGKLKPVDNQQIIDLLKSGCSVLVLANPNKKEGDRFPDYRVMLVPTEGKAAAPPPDDVPPPTEEPPVPEDDSEIPF